MPWPEIAQRLYRSGQLLLQFDVDLEGALVGSSRCDDRGRRSAPTLPFSDLRGRDHTLESKARELLRSLGADELARKIRVEWNPRMKSAAGRADYRGKLISLNPLLRNVDVNEVGSTGVFVLNRLEGGA